MTPRLLETHTARPRGQVALHGVAVLLTILVGPWEPSPRRSLFRSPNGGAGPLPPRLVAGLREHEHTGRQDIGLYRRARSWHLFAGRLLGAGLPIFVPLVFLAVGGLPLAAPPVQFLPLLALYGVA